jgi:hypothetical protein
MKHHAERHEKYCKKNPLNNHRCFQRCQHLIKDSDYLEDGNGNRYGTCTIFTCDITGKDMYSYKAEKSLYIECDGERMPLECEHYQGNWQEEL